MWCKNGSLVLYPIPYCELIWKKSRSISKFNSALCATSTGTIPVATLLVVRAQFARWWGCFNDFLLTCLRVVIRCILSYRCVPSAIFSAACQDGRSRTLFCMTPFTSTLQSEHMRVFLDSSGPPSFSKNVSTCNKAIILLQLAVDLCMMCDWRLYLYIERLQDIFLWWIHDSQITFITLLWTMEWLVSSTVAAKYKHGLIVSLAGKRL